MKIKNFGLLREIVTSKGDNLIDLVKIAGLNEKQTKSLKRIIEGESIIDRLEKNATEHPELDFIDFEKMRKQVNEVAHDYLQLTRGQVIKIFEKYDYYGDLNDFFEKDKSDEFEEITLDIAVFKEFFEIAEKKVFELMNFINFDKKPEKMKITIKLEFDDDEEEIIAGCEFSEEQLEYFFK